MKKEVAFSAATSKEVYSLLTQIIIPRPIAWIHTVSKSKIGNLAPFSYFNGVCSNPPILMVSITSHEKKNIKDTLINIKETEEFTVSIPTVSQINEVVDSAADYEYGVDESKVLSIEMEPGTYVGSKKVKQSPVNLECKLEKIVPFGDPEKGGVSVVFGRVLAVFIDEKIIDNNFKVDPLKLNPLCRLGRAYYGALGEIFTRKIPEL